MIKAENCCRSANNIDSLGALTALKALYLFLALPIELQYVAHCLMHWTTKEY